MSKKLQLQIPTPCHENWENMTKADKGRFCASCQKQVIDFSNMSDREIALFFKKPILTFSKDGSVCGRFMEDQLNKEIEIPRKRVPWVKYFFQFLLPAFFVSYKANAQGKVKVVIKNEVGVASNCNNITMGKPMLSAIKQNSKFNEPNIKQERIAIIPDIQLPHISENTLTASELNSTMHDPKPGSRSLAGYAGKVAIRLGGVSATRCYVKKRSNTIQLFQKIFKDTAFSNFRIYPNPVQSNSTLKIEWKQKEFDNHIFQLFNQSGQLVFTKEMYIDGEARSLSINMPPVPSGNYFLKITSVKTGKSYTEKLIVK